MFCHRTLHSAAAAVCFMVIGGAAHAQWIAHASGPDVFGNTKVLAAAANGGEDGLVIQCGGADPIALAYIMPGTQDELNALSKPDANFPAELLVKVDTDAVQKFDARLEGWNTRFLGVVFTGRTTELAALIHAIGRAQRAIEVGADIAGNKQSDSFGVVGSTAAMNAVVKDCDVDQIKPAAGSDDATQPQH